MFRVLNLRPSNGHYVSRACVVVLIFVIARRLRLFSSSILAANKSLIFFQMTNLAAKRSQLVVLN